MVDTRRTFCFAALEYVFQSGRWIPDPGFSPAGALLAAEKAEGAGALRRHAGRYGLSDSIFMAQFG